jgi:hypothetical protein
MDSLIAWEQFSKGLIAVQAASNAISLSDNNMGFRPLPVRPIHTSYARGHPKE